MKTLKNIFILLIVSAAVLNAETNLRNNEAFKNAVDYTAEAEQLQNDGQYDPSMEKAKDANTAMDEAFIDALHLLLQKKASISRDNAQSQINTLEKSGALTDSKLKQSFQEMKVNISNGDSLLQKAAEERSSDEEITKAYDAAIAEYNKAEKSAKSANEQYIAQKRAEADKAIKDAQVKYSTLTGKGVISKNGADGKRIDGFLQSAQKALSANDFNGVSSNVKSALDAMNNSEKTFAAESAKVKKQLDDAQKRFSQLKSGKIISGGSADDKNITKLLSDASSALNSGNLQNAQTSISNAVSKMNSVESEYKTASANAKKLLDDLAARQKKLNAGNTLVQGSDNDKEVSKLLGLARDAFAKNDFKEASANAEKARQIMDNAEKEAADGLKNAKDLINKAKQRHAELAKTYNLADEDSDNVSIIEDLENAEKALNSGDWNKASEAVNAANAKMDYLEKMLSDLAETENTDNSSEAQNNSTADTETKTEITTDQRFDADGLPIDESGRVTVLPKYYVVRKQMPITDCMWRIAAMNFVYGDRNEWRRIYELNKNNFVQSSNPHLIVPGQILEIPSLRGEERQGTYNPEKRYVPFTEN
ncbi:MAG: hypothetical protein ACTTI5_06675 [Treponema sp.]